MFGRFFHKFDGVPRPIEEGGLLFDRLTTIGVWVDKNQSLGLDSHHMTLAVPLCHVAAMTRKPDITCSGQGPTKSDMEEYYIWDVAHCHVEILGPVPGAGVSRYERDGKLIRLRNPTTTAPLDPALLDGRLGTPDPSGTAQRLGLTVTSGVFDTLSRAGARPVRFGLFHHPNPIVVGTTVSAADGAKLTVTARAGDTISIAITRLTNQEKWLIVLQAIEIDKPDGTSEIREPVATLQNTCGCLSAVDALAQRRDLEFAAYYELLANPLPETQRLVPIVQLIPSVFPDPSCDVNSGSP